MKKGKRAVQYVLIWAYVCNLTPAPVFSHSIYYCFDIPVIDLIEVAASHITQYVLSHLLGLHPTSCSFFFLFSLLSVQPSPCRGDLPRLLTDNSDRKLLHVITLLKSQFTQPQQIILRWVPGVMETVFSTLRPASPALSKNPHWVSLCGSGGRRAPSLPPFPFVLLFSLPTSLLFALPSLLSTSKRTALCLLGLTLFVAKLYIIQVTEGAALRRLLDLFLDGAVLTGCCLTQFI